jgi:hypothetical protein
MTDHPILAAAADRARARREEPTVIMCDALEASPLAEGQQLACFLRPHPEDSWHYDNRGLGVWFRAVPGGIDARVGLTVHPDEAPEESVTVEEQADRLRASNLPMLFATAGQLDVDRLRALAPEVRTGLIAALRAEAAELRAGRGTVVVPEDTFDLVRRVTAAEEVLRQWAQAFTAAAAECVAIAEEEALTANGGLPGYEEAPSGSLFVPDGAGQRIAVTPDWKPGESTWDVASLAGWVVEEAVAEVRDERRQEARRRAEERQAAADPTAEGVPPEPLDPAELAAELAWYESDAQQAAHGAVFRLLQLGTYTPGIKKLDALRKRLSEQGRDSDAAVIRQVRSVGLRAYKGVKVTREEIK